MIVITIKEFNEAYPGAVIDPRSSYDSYKKLVEGVVEKVNSTKHEFVYLLETSPAEDSVIVMK